MQESQTHESPTQELDVRLLTTIEEMREADRLLRNVWGAGPGDDAPFTVDTMRALSHTGGYVAAAFLGGEMVGVAGGFHAISGPLHSHVAGVMPGLQGKGIGLAMKQHQRLWAAGHGIASVSWTYDPLVRRNAYFNLARLGAHAVEYLPEFYGVINDSINAGDLTDRMYVDWPVAEDAPADLPPLESFEAVVDIEGPRPVAPTSGPADWSPLVRCAVPADIEALRRTDPDAARAWRLAVRAGLHGAMSAGYDVVGFDRAGWYLLQRTDSHHTDTPRER
ncbi:MAG: GNAT family N-acetyltransferase [Knoellia sp.]